jgi:hypothetical protein
MTTSQYLEDARKYVKEYSLYLQVAFAIVSTLFILYLFSGKEEEVIEINEFLTVSESFTRWGETTTYFVVLHKFNVMLLTFATMLVSFAIHVYYTKLAANENGTYAKSETTYTDVLKEADTYTTGMKAFLWYVLFSGVAYFLSVAVLVPIVSLAAPEYNNVSGSMLVNAISIVYALIISVLHWFGKIKPFIMGEETPQTWTEYLSKTFKYYGSRIFTLRCKGDSWVPEMDLWNLVPVLFAWVAFHLGGRGSLKEYFHIMFKTKGKLTEKSTRLEVMTSVLIYTVLVPLMGTTSYTTVIYGFSTLFYAIVNKVFAESS